MLRRRNLARQTQKWRNWQTRTVQVRVVEIPCGFDSHLLHVWGKPCIYAEYRVFTRFFTIFGWKIIQDLKGIFQLFKCTMQHGYHTLLSRLFSSSKCWLIFRVCRAVSRSITLRYTVFMTLSELHPPRWRMYWSGTPMACMMEAA